MLEFTWTGFGFAVVNFLLLTALLWKFLHKPLLRTLDKRQESIEKVRKSAESDRQEAASLKTEYQKKLTDAAAECDALLAEARSKAEANGEKILAEAAEQAKRSIAGLTQADERERREAQADLQQSVVDSALKVAATILAKLSDDDIESRLAADLLSDLDKLASGRDSVSIAKKAAVLVTSALELSDKLRAEILKRIQALGAGEEQVEFAVDQSLVAGTRVEFSDRVVDGSLADVIARIREDARAAVAPEPSGEDDS